MTMPAMEAGLARAILQRWAQNVDAGPYSSLAMGERIPFDNPDIVALLGACAAWTTRVRLAASIFVPQLHDPALLAKQIATADVLSEGRIVAGFGSGAREEDYRAAGADWNRRRMGELARLVGVVKSVWAGNDPCEGLSHRVGPLPLQPGGPPVMAGVRLPKSVKAAAAWADGVFGLDLGPDVDRIDRYFSMVRTAWEDSGKPKPRLCISFWYALGADADRQLEAHLRRYFSFYTRAQVDALLPITGFRGSPQRLKDLLKRIEDVGADEVLLVPTCIDPAEPERVAEILV